MGAATRTRVARFDPRSAGSLRAGFHAAHIAGAAGDLCATWSDFSGNARHLTAAGTARPTIAVLNGHRVLSFDGVNNRLAHTNAATWGSSTNPVTMFVVAGRASGAGQQHLIDAATTTDGAFRQILYQKSGSPGAWSVAGNVGEVLGANHGGPALDVVSSIHGAGVGADSISVNGAARTTGTAGTGVLDTLQVSGVNGASFLFAGYIGAVLFYNGQLSAAAIKYVERGLGGWFGLAVA